MSINFPTSLDTLTNPTATDNTVTVSHATQHANANDAVEALEAKVGVDSSAVTSSLDYKLKNASSVNPGHKHTLAGALTDVNVAPVDGSFLAFNLASSQWVASSTSAPDASTTVKGVSKMSVAPASAANPIAVGDNDGRVPTQGENDALVGTSGTPSSTNKYVTNLDTTIAVVSSSVVRRNATGDVTVNTTPTATTDASSKAYVDGKITTNLVTGFVTVASTNLRTSNDGAATNNTESYVKVKEILYNDSPGSISVAFALESTGASSYGVSGRIYKNGSAVGTERTHNAGPTTHTETLTFATGDLIQIYAKINGSSGQTASVTNFRLYYDKIGLPVANTNNL